MNEATAALDAVLAGGRRRRRTAILALSALVGALALASLSVGPTGLAPVRALGDWLLGIESVAALTLVELRLPRAALGALVGGALGLAGAAMQGLLRNPLAEPGVLGVSSCAALAAVTAFYTGASALFPLALPTAGVLGALAGAALVWRVAGPGASTLALVLAGVAINAAAGALVALALALSPSPYAFYEASFWLMGSLADRSLAHVALAAPFVAAGGWLLWRVRSDLDALALGEEGAAGLGVDLRRLDRWTLWGTALCVGAAVAVAGVVAFIGLMGPHLARRLVGGRASTALWPSALLGAALTLAADIVVRVSISGRELQLGTFTALIGAPFLAWIARRARGGGDA